MSIGTDLAEDVALARAVAAAASAVPGVSSVGGAPATYGANETVRGVAIDRRGAAPVVALSFAAEYDAGADFRELAGRVRRAALRAARMAGATVSRVDITVHDVIVPGETESS